MESNLKVLVLNGPNLNLLGQREPTLYGAQSLEDVENSLLECADALGMEITSIQTNFEGELLQHVQEADAKYNLIVINPGALTHTSYALRDAIAAISTPTVEVHITNIYSREEWRNNSVISSVCWGTIAGLGSIAYRLALEAGYNLYHNILSAKVAEEAVQVPMAVQADGMPVAWAGRVGASEAQSAEVQHWAEQAQQYAEAAQLYAEQAQAAQAAPAPSAGADVAVAEQLVCQMQDYVAQAQLYAEQAQAAQVASAQPAGVDVAVAEQLVGKMQDYVAQAQLYAEQAQAAQAAPSQSSGADVAVAEQLVSQMQDYVAQAQLYAEQAQAAQAAPAPSAGADVAVAEQLVSQMQDYVAQAQRYAEQAQVAQATPAQSAGVDMNAQQLILQMQDYVAQAQLYAEQAQAAQTAPAPSAGADVAVAEQLVSQMQDYVAQAQLYAEQAQAAQAAQTPSTGVDMESMQRLVSQMQDYVAEAQLYAELAQQTAGHEMAGIVSAAEPVKSETHQYRRSEEHASQFVRSKEHGRSRSAENKAPRAANSGVFISEEELPTFTPTCNPKRYQTGAKPAIEEGEPIANKPQTEVADAVASGNENNNSAVFERAGEADRPVADKRSEEPHAVADKQSQTAGATPKKKKPVRLELVFGETKLAPNTTEKSGEQIGSARKHSSLELAIPKDLQGVSLASDVAPEPILSYAETPTEEATLATDARVDTEAGSVDDGVQQDDDLIGEVVTAPDMVAQELAQQEGEQQETPKLQEENAVALSQEREADLPVGDLLAAVENVVSKVAGLNDVSDGDAGEIAAAETAESSGAGGAGTEEGASQTEVSPSAPAKAESAPQEEEPSEAPAEEGGRQTGRNKKGWRKKLNRLQENSGKKR